MSYVVEFEELSVLAVSGLSVTGRAHLGMNRDEWWIDDIDLADAVFSPISRKEPLGALLFEAVKCSLEVNRTFVDDAEAAHAEEYPNAGRSDADEHGTYRVSSGRVVG